MSLFLCVGGSERAAIKCQIRFFSGALRFALKSFNLDTSRPVWHESSIYWMDGLKTEECEITSSSSQIHHRILSILGSLDDSITSKFHGLQPQNVTISNSRKRIVNIGLHADRLRHSRFRLITDPPRWQKEQRNHCTIPYLQLNQHFTLLGSRCRLSPYLGIMMCPGTRTRPASTLPPTHPHKLRLLIELNHTVDFPIWMLMILPSVAFITLHVHRSDTEEPRLFLRQAEFRTAVFGTVYFDGGAPSFVVVDALADVLAEIFVVWISRTVALVQVLFEIFTGGSFDERHH